MSFNTKGIDATSEGLHASLYEIECFKDSSLWALQKYVEQSNKIIDSIEAKLNSRLQKDLQNERNEAKRDDIHYEWHQDYENEYLNFEQITLKSLLLAVYSFFEFNLFEVCRIAQKEIQLLVKASDMKEKGVKQAYFYLTKILKVDIEKKFSKDWSKICDYKVVRNHIVHNNFSQHIAQFDTSKLEELTNVIQKNKKYLSFSKNIINLRIKDSRYISDFLIVSNSFLNSILLEIDELIKNNLQENNLKSK